MQDFDGTSYDGVLRSGPGRGLAAGVDFSRRFGLEGAIDWPESHVAVSVSGPHPTYYPVGRESYVLTNTYRAPTISVSFAAHLAENSRSHVTLLAGLARVQQPVHSHIVEDELGPADELLSRSERDWDVNYAETGLVLGIDVPVRLIGSLWVVPAVHVVCMPISSDYFRGVRRTSIGLRWTY